MCCWLDYLLVVGEGGIWIIKFNVFKICLFLRRYILVRDKIILCIIRKRIVEVFGSVV